MSSISSPNWSSGSKRPLDSAFTSDHFNSTTQKYPKTDERSLLPSPAGDVSYIKFFVRTISTNHRTIFFREKADYQISSVLQKIESLTRIPIFQQRLIYQRKELQSEMTLNDAKVQNNAVLQMVGRLRSSIAGVWGYVNGIIEYAVSLYNMHNLGVSPGDHSSAGILDLVHKFLLMGLWNIDNMLEYLEIFSSCSGPQVLVMLSACSNRSIAYHCRVSIYLITQLITKMQMPENIRYRCIPIVIEFCTYLCKVKAINGFLYYECRSSMIELFKSLPNVSEDDGLVFGYLIPFVVELLGEISHHFGEGVVWRVSSLTIFSANVSHLCEFMIPVMKNLILRINKSGVCFRDPFNGEQYTLPRELADGISALHCAHSNLLTILDIKLKHFEEQESIESSHFLRILKELNSISKLYDGSEDKFWAVMIKRKDVICNLIIKYAHIMEDYRWILKVKEATTFEIRRDLALMMLPKLEDGVEKYEIIVDRSNLLSESFYYIGNLDPESLRSGLLIQFKDEEAIGFGVIREWFLLACQEIFHPRNGLFVACPNNGRRFFPNKESEQDPLHLQYFRFCGRLIALALMHKVQVGFSLDRIFFLQLTGQGISLNDIQDADPILYSSCKKILDMDSVILDQDELSLTFSHEIESFGTRKVVELCPGGSNIVVNSKNRVQYVNSLINKLFVTSISEQIDHFAEGFFDIMRRGSVREYFFQRLYLEDLDVMLRGNESEICVEDWQAHTDYRGFKSSDHHISWFWKIVRGMSDEQKRILLFFWTSIKYLPFEGFSGLSSRLCILKSSESLPCLPSSRTCFYQLSLPGYGSFTIMCDYIHIITQEHISCSFGAA